MSKLGLGGITGLFRFDLWSIASGMLALCLGGTTGFVSFDFAFKASGVMSRRVGGRLGFCRFIFLTRIPASNFCSFSSTESKGLDGLSFGKFNSDLFGGGFGGTLRPEVELESDFNEE